MRKEVLEEALQIVEEVLTSLQRFQINKAAAFAREIRPDLTWEDLLNPDDYPQIKNNPNYMYEDGQSAGILSAKMAIKSAIRERIESIQDHTSDTV